MGPMIATTQLDSDLSISLRIDADGSHNIALDWSVTLLLFCALQRLLRDLGWLR